MSATRSQGLGAIGLVDTVNAGIVESSSCHYSSEVPVVRGGQLYGQWCAGERHQVVGREEGCGREPRGEGQQPESALSSPQ